MLARIALTPDREEIRSAFDMKMLFSRRDGTEANEVKKKLADAGIRCEIRKNPLAQGVFGIPPAPELLIEEEDEILKALRVIGARRLREMTIIFPTH